MYVCKSFIAKLVHIFIYTKAFLFLITRAFPVDHLMIDLSYR